MSAIFGVYNLDGEPVAPSLLEKMSDTLAHRGADGKGIWSDGAIGFGHRMLWTTPESLHEQLPKSVGGANLAITADARIDNRDDLLRQLGEPRETVSDSEIILLAYEKWGEDCTAKLIGDFAFAVWDRQNRRVFCARDHFGVKSLYYYHSENVFVFATEVKALLGVPRVPHALNETKIGDYLTGVYDDVSSTFYKDIYRLPAKSQISVELHQKRSKIYWSLDSGNELNLASDEEYAGKFRELFTEAVRCRMRSAYPVGSMLSGGLDSSSIACTARQLLIDERGNDQNEARKLHTFSAVFGKDSKSDESFYINAVLKQGGFEPHFLKANQVSPYTDLEKIIWHQDEAIHSGNLYINWHLYQAAQASGVRVILDGYDGDTTVSHGKNYFLELARSKRWRTLLREVRGYAKNSDESATAIMWAYYWRHGLEPKLPKNRAAKPLRQVGRRLYGMALATDKNAQFKDSDFDVDLNPDFLERISLAEHHRSLRESQPRSPKTEREDHYIKFLAGTIPSVLENIDKAAAPFAVEVRYPFWDKRLAEFCLSLPANQKMHRGLTRMIMRRAMDGILPKEVQWRPGKADLSYSYTDGLGKFEVERLNNSLKTNRNLLEKYINVDSLTEKYESFADGKANILDLIKISSSVSLALWLRSAKLNG